MSHAARLTSKKPREEPHVNAPPLDLTKYYESNQVDLNTLSELTRSVGPPFETGTARSKRRCVRVREEITKLQELLDEEKSKPPVGKGQAKRPTQTKSVIGNKRSRSGRSQFTSRRKRKKKPHEEG